MLSLKEALERRTGMDCVVQEAATYHDVFSLWFASRKAREEFLEVYNFLVVNDTGDLFDIFRNACAFSMETIDIGETRYGLTWEWNKPHEAVDLWNRLHWILDERLPKKLKP